MGYNQGLAKENIMSQYLNCMNSGQGKILHMGIMDFHINKVLDLLRPGNSQATTVRDSPQSTFPTSPWLFGLGNPFGLRFDYRRSSNKNKGFYRLRLSPLCIFLYFLTLSMICKCLSNMQIDKEYEEWSQCDAQVFPLVLDSLASKSHTNENKIN